MKNLQSTILLLMFLWTRVDGQSPSYAKIRISPNTHFVMAGNTHLVLENTSMRVQGQFEPGESRVHFTGNSSDSLTGDSPITFYDLAIAKSGDANFYIPPELPCICPITVGHQLIFDSQRNRILLGARNLILGAGAGITGGGADNFVVTADTGMLVKESIGQFTFPVGSSLSRYTPLKIGGASGPLHLGVRCLPHVLSGGLTGNATTTGVVDVSWVLRRTSTANSSFTMTPQWNVADELTGFDGNDCGVSMSLGNGDWDLAGMNIGQKSGQGPYVRNRTGVQLDAAASAVFCVGSEPVMFPLRVALKTYLQGAYDESSGLMQDQLRVNQLIPFNEPYSTLRGFSHSGRGGQEKISPAVLSRTGSEAIVDWVFVELRPAANSTTILETRSALIRRDGRVVDVDGTSPVVFRGREAGNYYAAVRHRNHLGIRTANALPLINQPVAYLDASASQYNVLDGVQAKLGTSQNYGMYGGDANGNGSIRYSGPENDQNALLNGCLGGNKSGTGQNAYSGCDLNLDGTIRYSGPLNDQNTLLNTVLTGNKAKVIAQPKF